MKIKSISKINANNSELFKKEYLLPEKPAILEGISKNWPATSSWSMDYFIKNYGNAQVPLSYYKSKGQEKYSKQKRMLLKDYFTQIIEGHFSDSEEYPYVAGWMFANDFPELLDDIETSPLCFPDNWLPAIPSSIYLPLTTLFFGHKDVSSPLHTDSFFVNTWLTVICGKKKVRMVSPIYTELVSNGMDLFNKNTANYLLKKDVEIMEGEAGESDAIYIPPGWWHNVINVDFSIAVQNLYVDIYRFPLFEQQIRRIFMPTMEKLISLGQEATKSLMKSGYECSHPLLSHKVSDFVELEQNFISFLSETATQKENYLRELIRQS